VFRIRWINAKCDLTRCTEELIILRFEMQMCYLGYNSRARAWQRRKVKMKDSAGHTYMAQAYVKEWTDMAAHAKKKF
ncbi:hypothetical protein PENSPDRAFT_566377, partial [Peniophora sp. CONT]